MKKPLKIALTVGGIVAVFYLGRLAYIHFKYPSQDKANAKDIKPAGSETVNPSV